MDKLRTLSQMLLLVILITGMLWFLTDILPQAYTSNSGGDSQLMMKAGLPSNSSALHTPISISLEDGQ